MQTTTSPAEPIDAIGDPSLEVARAAISRLADIEGGRAATALRERLLTSDLSLTRHIARTLRRIGDPTAADAAITGLHGGQPRRHRSGAGAARLRRRCPRRGTRSSHRGRRRAVRSNARGCSPITRLTSGSPRCGRWRDGARAREPDRHGRARPRSTRPDRGRAPCHRAARRGGTSPVPRSRTARPASPSRRAADTQAPAHPQRQRQATAQRAGELAV